ncbi:putative 2OG-Fe(II) oxygenase [Altericroceibacterium xinjiangense]|uniref:putative 2OG-Fe(II) oxygenase n=1 Tax=Altericroceibacterium xinjiangense TaxID=762261 RepID=UPI000F7D6227|nr:putative 2OG-Fe(II) oxygenase [Altericroceibacterium xinjiangense]
MAGLPLISARLADARSDDCAALHAAAKEAVVHGAYEAVRDRLRPLLSAVHRGDAGLWQLYALALRGLGESAEAAQAFRRAADLNPGDPLLTHSLARTTLEAGDEAVALFDVAIARAPADASVRLGRAAAQLASGAGENARADLAALLLQTPGWLAGHAAYANLTAMIAPGEDPLATIDAAVARFPADRSLIDDAIALAMRAEDYTGALMRIARARERFGPDAALAAREAACLAETGSAAEALRVFGTVPVQSAGDVIWRVRTLLRVARPDEAAALLERRWPDGDRALWPYRALVWRLTADPRWHWLEGDERLIRTYDIAGELGDPEELADCLRALHCNAGQQLDQSVRGGSQTDGNLLVRAEPPLRRLRTALLHAVGEYVAQLPPPVDGHPTLIADRGPLRIAGSWSVRLTDAGLHVDHVHSHGWLSSAFYVALPEPDKDRDTPQAGWLAFGENRDLAPDLPAFRLIEPRAGTLALFPSITWHGTRAFAQGERMTVAFDIALPAGARE